MLITNQNKAILPNKIEKNRIKVTFKWQLSKKMSGFIKLMFTRIFYCLLVFQRLLLRLLKNTRHTFQAIVKLILPKESCQCIAPKHCGAEKVKVDTKIQKLNLSKASTFLSFPQSPIAKLTIFFYFHQPY